MRGCAIPCALYRLPVSVLRPRPGCLTWLFLEGSRWGDQQSFGGSEDPGLRFSPFPAAPVLCSRAPICVGGWVGVYTCLHAYILAWLYGCTGALQQGWDSYVVTGYSLAL